MLNTIEGLYKDGKVTLGETPEGLEETPVLVTFLTKRMGPAQPQVLYGAWQGRMPADIDVEAVLNEIRSEWHAGVGNERE